MRTWAIRRSRESREFLSTYAFGIRWTEDPTIILKFDTAPEAWAYIREYIPSKLMEGIRVCAI